MTTREAVQLGVAALFPLALVGGMLVFVARHRGRTGAQIALGLGGIIACLLGVIGTGIGLSALRGGPLFDFSAGAFGSGPLTATDVVGLLVCAGCLIVALRVSKWLTGGPEGDPVPSGEDRPSEGG